MQNPTQNMNFRFSPNLCSSPRILIRFFFTFHEFTIEKSSKIIRGVVKSEGPVTDVAKKLQTDLLFKAEMVTFR